MMDKEESLRRRREATQKWRDAHPERAREYRRERRQTGGEEFLSKEREYKRAYYKAHRETILEQKRQEYVRRLDKITEYAKRYRDGHREIIKARQAQWATSHRGHRKEYLAVLRSQVIEAYGGRCACCGEKQIKFLALDHINNDGKAHRLEIGSSTGIYFWARRNGYPKDKLQVLCHNCNMAKELYGACPHGECG